jgi:hypothetical protein
MRACDRDTSVPLVTNLYPLSYKEASVYLVIHHYHLEFEPDIKPSLRPEKLKALLDQWDTTRKLGVAWAYDGVSQFISRVKLTDLGGIPPQEDENHLRGVLKEQFRGKDAEIAIHFLYVKPINFAENEMFSQDVVLPRRPPRSRDAGRETHEMALARIEQVKRSVFGREMYMDFILHQRSTLHRFNHRRSYFDVSKGGETVPIPTLQFAELYRGYRQTILDTETGYLMSSNPAGVLLVRSLPLISRGECVLETFRRAFESSRPVGERDLREMERAVQGLRFQTKHISRKYK